MGLSVSGYLRLKSGLGEAKQGRPRGEVGREKVPAKTLRALKPDDGEPKWYMLDGTPVEFNRGISYKPVEKHAPAEFDSSPERKQRALDALVSGSFPLEEPKADDIEDTSLDYSCGQ